MGDSERFDAAMQAFALTYAEQNAHDFADYTAAIQAGTVEISKDESQAARLVWQPFAQEGPLAVSVEPAPSPED
jgi:hypothetical protein